jgi:hypothetical protein
MYLITQIKSGCELHLLFWAMEAKFGNLVV